MILPEFICDINAALVTKAVLTHKAFVQDMSAYYDALSFETRQHMFVGRVLLTLGQSDCSSEEIVWAEAASDEELAEATEHLVGVAVAVFKRFEANRQGKVSIGRLNN